MDWLKDKKNLPIVVGVAVFILLAAGGLMAFETGLIGAAPVPVAAVPQVPPAAGGGPPGLTPVSGRLSPPSPAVGPPGPHPGVRTASAAPAAPTVPVAPKLVNPAVGPDPFGIPGGQVVMAKRISGADTSPTGMKLPLRDLLPVYNLFTLLPPAPPPTVDIAGNDPGAQNYRLTGIENSDGRILAILETSGQSQTVKPGDGLPDGGKVLSIQTTSVTLRTPGGSTVSIPLTSGAGPVDQPLNGQDPNAFNQGQQVGPNAFNQGQQVGPMSPN